MKSDIIYSLINNDIFRQDVMKYLEIETDKNFEITESEDLVLLRSLKIKRALSELQIS